ncbi:MAG: hypothetical protein H6876_07615 [Hyphomicrobiaceae bacterium]|nr:hypothetical protein [Hyphomicrobiaceae bacterium]
MRTSKILEKLDRLLEPDLSKGRRARELEDLLDRLESKKQKFEDKIERVESFAERVELVRKRQICLEQIERGRRALSGARREEIRY